MKEKMYISIPEPCHEDWDQMTSVEKGKYCDVCKKNVVDFSTCDDEEVLDFFKNYSGNTCGRFTDEQLNRPLQKIEFRKASSFLRYAASLLLPALFFSQKSSAQNGKVAITTKGDTMPKSLLMPGETKQTSPFSFSNEHIVIGRAISFKSFKKEKYLAITGRVVDEFDGSGIASATVEIKSKTVVTDSAGYFIIIAEKDDHPLEVNISSVGYQKTVLDISGIMKKSNFKDLKEIHLARNYRALNEITVSSESLIRRMGLTGTVSIISYNYGFLDNVKDTLRRTKVQLFPNPVANNGTIQLSFSNLSSGFYQIRVLNGGGQLFYSYQKQINSKNETEQIHLNEKMRAGIYFVQVTDGKNKLIQSLKLVVQ